ncbi:MATE family efflux transporter [Clostridium sp. DL1XJH146]
MKSNNRIILTEGSIGKILKDLTLPMIFGILGIVAFNLADTYFVGKLGTIQMAALTFTFPVILVINSLNHGIGIGTSAAISKAVGENQKDRVIRLSTHSLILGVIVALTAIIIGELTIEPLFRALGADEATLPYIIDYMTIWYAGVPFIVIPVVGNNVIRALGDTKTPSFVMLVAASINIVLDPLLIMGIGILPELNVSGAALATVISRAFTFCVALYILIVREKVVSLHNIKLKEVIESWTSILFIGIPNAIARMVIPIGVGIITGLIATLGTETVAGFGIATKIEYFAIAIINALASVLPVFVGQNFGAKKISRIKEAIVISEKFSLISGIIIYIVLAILARPISYLFTKDALVSNTIVTYFRIVPLGYAFQGMLLIINGSLNAIHKPFKAASINLIQMLAIYVPLAIITSKHFGIVGIFISLVSSYFIVGVIAHIIIHKDIEKLAN